ncbi:MAG: undecaprenyl-diphosphatase UppP [Candidatus Doudnabacteria bacterium]|nr:undecaprenyl-diphosphatase UppP [Candidatus Doudnabacteria bacterium]
MFEAFILGLVQGLGEFLPISSSAHLIVTPWLFGWRDQGLGFDLALHWGTLFAVVVYFRKDILLLLKGFLHSLRASTRDLHANIYQRLAWLVIIATIPAAVIGKILEPQVEHLFRNPLLIACTMFGFGIVLLVADLFGQKVKNLDHAKPVHAVLVGLSQALALVPGVSRSGSTIAAGLALGFKRADAARFSFLMSIPITMGAGLLKIGDFGVGVTLGEVLVGFLTSAIVGFLAIRFLLQLLTKRGFMVFVSYRIAFAVLIVAVYFLR